MGVIGNIEIERSYFHSLAGDSSPPVRAILDNGKQVSIHDSYISGMMSGESQGIAYLCSPGPSAYTNNFIEGAGENVLGGGSWCSSGIPNTNKLLQGNYIYKPPMWKISGNPGVSFQPVGACLYDNTDPNFVGGEYAFDIPATQWYQCNSSSVWATSSAPANLGNPTVKTMTEHKNGRYITYLGNLYNYNWSAGQNNGAQQGQVWNNSMEGGSGPGMANDHITMINNAAYNIFTPVNRVSECGIGALVQCFVPTSSHVFVNNLIVQSPYACFVYGTSVQTTCATGFAQASGWSNYGTQPSLTSDYFSKNTIFSPDSPSYGSAGPVAWYGNVPIGGCSNIFAVNRAAWSNSIMAGDFSGDCYSGAGGAEIANYFNNSSFTNIALKGGTNTYLATEGPNTTNIFKPASNTILA